MNHYPHHIGDFDRATRHLTRLERSIYRDLIDLYYDTERPLTLDREKLCRRIIARSNEEETAVEQVLNEFFTETQTGWYHDRCEEEIYAYLANTSQKALAGKASAEAKRLRKLQALSGNSTNVERSLNERKASEPAEFNGESTNQEPRTKNQEPTVINPNHGLPALSGEDEIQQLEENTPIAKSCEPPRFAEFWAAYPKKSGRKAALGAWRTKRLDSRADELIADVRLRSGSDRKWLEGFIPNPATYLNGERWNDEIERANGARSSPNKPSAGEITMQNFENVMRRMDVGGET